MSGGGIKHLMYHQLAPGMGVDYNRQLQFVGAGVIWRVRLYVFIEKFLRDPDQARSIGSINLLLVHCSFYLFVFCDCRLLMGC